jgi:basic membrane protein A
VDTVRKHVAILMLALSVFIFAGWKIAAIFPGVINDRDYNQLGYQALMDLKKEFGMEVAYSQRVAVPDAARVMEEYIDSGYNIIWTHGGQYVKITLEVAKKHPDVYFIIEDEAPPSEYISNVFTLGREYHLGFYVLGALAAMVTKTGHIGFISGLELPFTYGEINAIYQAIKDLGLEEKVELHYIYTGDFNDPLKARQAAETLISKGCDVLISGLNLGNFGLFEAVKKSKKEVYFTATYTDKSQSAPENFLAADLFNFSYSMKKLVKAIMSGEKGRYFPMEWGKDKARYTEIPVKNVSIYINEQVKKLAEKIEKGEIKVVKELRRLMIGK